MKRLEVSCAVRHIYIYVYIYVISRLRVKGDVNFVSFIDTFIFPLLLGKKIFLFHFRRFMWLGILKL
jgi:hypothetical protein